MAQQACACRCRCDLDGLGGDLCDQPLEQTCMNQCSGHGNCYLGFCKCDEGWYGHDCARRHADATTSNDTGAPFGCMQMWPNKCFGKSLGALTGTGQGWACAGLAAETRASW